VSLIQTIFLVELTATMPHTDLVDSCKRGDASGFRKLYELYSKAMFNTSFRILNDQAEAEDVLQESFTDAFRHIHSFANKSSFGSWLKQIVVNKSINVLRKRRLETVDIDKVWVSEIPEDSNIDEKEIQLKVQEVRKAIQLLPDGYRTVLSLYLLEGYDHEEISQIMGLAESTTRTQYMRAKQKLLQILKEGGAK
jgi:RNA polymerase sigma-70 factor (ECF subfamily)